MNIIFYIKFAFREFMLVPRKERGIEKALKILHGVMHEVLNKKF